MARTIIETKQVRSNADALAWLLMLGYQVVEHGGGSYRLRNGDREAVVATVTEMTVEVTISDAR